MEPGKRVLNIRCETGFMLDALQPAYGVGVEISAEMIAVARREHPQFTYVESRCGEVYNLGGGRRNSISILETIEALRHMGFTLDYSYREENRRGDHICYISDLSKLQGHYPVWKQEYDLPRILREIVDRHLRTLVC